jgi:hypothetical protein
MLPACRQAGMLDAGYCLPAAGRDAGYWILDIKKANSDIRNQTSEIRYQISDIRFQIL